MLWHKWNLAYSEKRAQPNISNDQHNDKNYFLPVQFIIISRLYLQHVERFTSIPGSSNCKQHKLWTSSCKITSSYLCQLPCAKYILSTCFEEYCNACWLSHYILSLQCLQKAIGYNSYRCKYTTVCHCLGMFVLLVKDYAWRGSVKSCLHTLNNSHLIWWLVRVCSYQVEVVVKWDEWVRRIYI